MAEIGGLTPTRLVICFKIALASYIYHVLNSSPKDCDKLNWLQLLFFLVFAEVLFSIGSQLTTFLNKLWQTLAGIATLFQFGWHCLALYWQFTGYEFLYCSELQWSVTALQTGWLGCSLFAGAYMLHLLGNK